MQEAIAIMLDRELLGTTMGGLPRRELITRGILLPRAGDVSLGYLAGCGGYTSEAPSFVFRVAAPTSGSLEFDFEKAPGETDAAGILVVTPSGDAHCSTDEISIPGEPGSYGVWVRAQTPGAPVDGIVDAYYRVP